MSNEDSSRTITAHHDITPHCTRVPVVVVQEEVDEERCVGCEEERFVGARHNETHIDVAAFHASTVTVKGRNYMEEDTTQKAEEKM